MLLHSLVPEVLERLVAWLDIQALVATQLTATRWQLLIQSAHAAWQRCYYLRFGSLPDPSKSKSWAVEFQVAIQHEQSVATAWKQGAVNGEHAFVFSSYVRSWASDDETLVAGLYDGHLQPVDWATGQVGPRFEGSHQDEVICVALNKDYVFSGSGDPGYYHRPPADACVRVWSRQGQQLGCFSHHTGSVRSVLLFPAHSPLGSYGMSAGMDSQLCLWSLPTAEQATGDKVRAITLPGPCRSLLLVESQAPSVGMACVGGSEQRVLAGVRHAVVELVVLALPTVSVEIRRLVQVSSYDVSSMACVVSPFTWTRLRGDMMYPFALLDDEGVVVAGGDTMGHIFVHQGTRDFSQPLRGNHEYLNEVVSAELLSEHRLLVVSRTGRLTCIEWGNTVDHAIVLWAKMGWRIYVSTIQRREPLLLVSDGFDNVIRSLRILE